MERFEACTSLRDLKAARDSLEDGNYKWSCFQAQQAAEKAVKALLYAYGRSSWGHSIVELLEVARELRVLREDLLVYARELDRHYIPSRCRSPESGCLWLFRVSTLGFITVSPSPLTAVQPRLSETRSHQLSL